MYSAENSLNGKRGTPLFYVPMVIDLLDALRLKSSLPLRLAEIEFTNHTVLRHVRKDVLIPGES